MAGHLLAAGHRVQGCDLRPAPAAALAALGGVVAPDPAAAAQGAGVVITSLPSVTALSEVVGGGRGLATAGPKA